MRAGVFLCECGGNISGVVDMEPLAEHARTLDGVVAVSISQFMCGTEGRALIEEAVEERGLDHLVVASCSPRFQGPTFERIARELELGENCVAFANIREGCSYVHAGEAERAQIKARRIVDSAVARLRHMSHLPRRRTFLNRSVLVVGGGIAGISAAEELAAAGIEVHLVEREQSIGGYMSRLSKTFPTEDCAMCSLAPRLTGAATNSRIHIHALSDVTSVTGPPGEFSVTVRHRARYVNEKCVGCGECSAVCPVTYPNDSDFGVSQRTAISRPFANAVPATFAVDRERCVDCRRCVAACPADAIDFDQMPWEEDLTVGAIILATGHQEFDATRKLPLGYGRFKNVLTQSQLARLLSASGPTAGELQRPSDGATPRRIFMLQCVGSRDCTSSGNEHCSAICCLFATLHSSLVKQHYPDAEITIGYTDMRTPGKAHEEYYRLVQERGVRYVRGRVGEILEELDGNLTVRMENTMTGAKSEEQYDLVVLSAGLEGSKGTQDVARIAGVQTTAAGFIREFHPKLAPVDTQRTGMFLCGTAQGPKTIPESIAQAKAAAARAVSMLSTGFAMTPAQVASSDVDVCVACGVCETACPQAAITITVGADAHSTVDPNSCRGCGICAAECPTGAMQLGGFSDAEVLAEATV